MVTFGSVHKEQSQEIAFSVQILHNFQTQGIRVRDMMRAVLVVVTLLLFLPMSAVSLPAGVGSGSDRHEYHFFTIILKREKSDERA